MVEGNILDLIPQRPPMVMIDELVFSHTHTARCLFRVCNGNVFVTGKQFSEAGMIESMAQTAAAWKGFAGHLGIKDPTIGYIGAVNHLVVISLPQVGDLITIDIEVINQIFDAVVLRGRVSDPKGQLLSQCEMVIFIGKK